MKKSNLVAVTLCCTFFVLMAISIARAEDSGSTVDQLNNELQRSGVITRNEANAIRSPLKNMAERGAGRNDLKNFVTDLSNKGVKGDDLKESVNSMNDLINKGANTKEAGNLVSRAAAQAHADGLKGKDLAAKVHEAVRQMQANKRASIQTKKEQKQTGNAGSGMGIGSGKGNSQGGGSGGAKGNVGVGRGHGK